MEPLELDSLHPSVAALSRIMRAMQDGVSLAERVRAVLIATVTALRLKGGVVRWLAPDRQHLELLATYGLSEGYLAKGRVEVGRSGLDQVVLQGKTVVIDDVGVDPRWQYPSEAVAEGIRSVLALPLRFGPRVVGVLRVYSAEPHHFSGEEIALLTAVADAAGASLENAKLYEALTAIAAAVHSSPTLVDVLRAILERSVVELGLRASLIRLYDPSTGELPLAAAYGLSETYLSKGVVDVARSLHDQRILAGAVIALEDLTDAEGFQYPDAALREGLVSALSVPLQAKQRVIGVLRVYTAVRHRFTPREIEFLTTVAHLGAMAIENARLYDTLQVQNKSMEADLQAWYSFVS